MKFEIGAYNRIYTADFETSTEAWNEPYARVWLWDICNERHEHIHGTSLDGFMHKVLVTACNTLYAFHNLSYDGTYIIAWLLAHGYKHTEKKFPKPKQFTTVISGLGSHYAYSVCTEHGQHLVFFDSLKYVNMSIERCAEAYRLPIKKGTLDYDTPRDVGHIPTSEEISYIENDTEIAMRTIQLNRQAGAKRFTQAGNARAEFKALFNKSDYALYFPVLNSGEDSYIRKAYAGGFVSFNKQAQNRVKRGAISLDINSMYPAQMLHRPMPYGYPEFFTGKYKPFKDYCLYIQRIRCAFHLKKGGIAMIATRRLFRSGVELYQEDSGGKAVELTLASPDLELFFDNYDVWALEYIDGCMFRSKKGREITPQEAAKMTVDEVIEEDGKGSLFYDYIKKWRYIKEHEPSGSALRDYAKRMQNALYGALAVNPERSNALPFLADGKVHYKLDIDKGGKPEYLPASVFITAWARYFLINCIKQVNARFLYCDTDSLYLSGKEPPKDFPVHRSLYGFFKVEHNIKTIKVIGAKRLMYTGKDPSEDDTAYRRFVTCCGADSNIKNQMNYRNFTIGAEFYGKKTVKAVAGGKHIGTTTYKLGKAPTE